MIVGPEPLEVCLEPVSAVPDAFAFAQLQSARPVPMHGLHRQQLCVREKDPAVYVPLAELNEIVGNMRRHRKDKLEWFPRITGKKFANDPARSGDCSSALGARFAPRIEAEPI